MSDSEHWHPMGCGPLDSMMTGDDLDLASTGTALALLRFEYTRDHRRHRPQFHDVLSRCAAIADRAGIPDSLHALPIWK